MRMRKIGQIVSGIFGGERAVETGDTKMAAILADKPVSINAGKRGQAGLTLLEAIAFLAIAGLVVGGALAMYSSASSSQATGTVVNEYQALRTAVKSLYTAPAGYTAASINGVLVTAKKVPSTLTASGTTITNQWGGGVIVMGATSQFYVSYDSVPKDVCVGMLTGVTQVNTWTGYNVVAAAAAVGAATSITSAVTPATASTACANDSNKVTLWTA